MKKAGAFLTLMILLFSSSFAKIHRVPCTYIATIQGGINVAKNGDTVLVMPGTYYENINFKGKNILVASNFIFDHDDSTILKTVIDGDNKASVVTFDSGEDSSACIQGFTITNGCRYAGAGIFCDTSSPKIVYNIIRENIANPGCIEPGVEIMGGGSGGGIYCYKSTSIIEHNSIIDNRSTLGQEMREGRGGGIYFLMGGPIIRYNLIASNIAEANNPPFAAPSGGGIWGWGFVLIYNNTIVNNDGGGIAHFEPLLGTKIFNNIVAFNDKGITLYSDTFLSILAHNDFGENEQDFYGFSSEVGDTTWGFNRNGVPCDSFYNIFRDPLFADTANFDFHLLAYSPCIDAGDPDSPLDPDSTIADIGAFYYPHTPTFVKDDDHNTPQRFELSQNYPNPFNPSTTIPYTVNGSQFMVHSPIHTTLKIYNLLGQLVRTLVDEEKTPGNYDVTWDGKDNLGKEVASGTYFYQLKIKDFTTTKKMILLR